MIKSIFSSLEIDISHTKDKLSWQPLFSPRESIEIIANCYKDSEV